MRNVVQILIALIVVGGAVIIASMFSPRNSLVDDNDYRISSEPNVPLLTSHLLEPSERWKQCYEDDLQVRQTYTIARLRLAYAEMFDRVAVLEAVGKEPVKPVKPAK